MTTDTFEHSGSIWLLGERLDYRQLVAIGVLVGLLAYALILYPLAYYGQFVAADAQVAAPVQEQEASMLNRLIFPLAAGLGMLILLLERVRATKLSLAVAAPFVVFWAYLGLTSFWALAPSTTIAKFIALTLLFLAIVPAVAVIDSAERYLKPMFWVAVVAILINLAFVFLTAPSAIGHTGIYSHKNSLGSAMAFCMLFLIYGITHPQRLYRLAGLLLIPVALFVLYRSQAKTALGLAFVAPTLAGIAVFARHYFRVPLPLLLIIVTPAAAFVLFGGVFDISLTDFSMLITGDPTFTGRTILWQFALEHIGERPWLGYGFQSFWQIGDVSPAWDGVRGFLQRTPHAHQGYLDLLLQGGFVALILFGIVYLQATAWISRKTDESAGIGWLISSLIILEALMNLLETTWLSTLDPGSMMFITIASAAMFNKPARPPTLLLQDRQPK